MSKTDIDRSYFVAFCIEQYKVARNMDGAAVADLYKDMALLITSTGILTSFTHRADNGLLKK